MKLRYMTAAALALTLGASLVIGCKTSQAELMSQAKITEADARKIAMEKVPNGTIKESELEKEHGHLQWSFDMTTPDTKDITEVNVDAITGTVLGVEHEKAEKEDKEKKADKD